MKNNFKIKSSTKRGVTLVEILSVVAIVAIIITVIIPQFSQMRENQVLKNAVNNIVSSLNKAKSQTLSSVNSSSYGVHFEEDRVVIFTGTSFSDSDPDNEEIEIIEPASISDISLAGGATEIYFKRLSGMPSVAGSLLVSTPNYSKTITISATGAMSVN